jgi:hypothetical protein
MAAPQSTTRSSLIIIAAMIIALIAGGYYIQDNEVVEDAEPETSQQSPSTDEDASGDSSTEAEAQTSADDSDATDEESESGAADASENAPAATSSDADSNESGSYSYTAVSGDSYTTLARKAIADYDASLTHAERVAAETKLVAGSGTGHLAIGHVVTMQKSAVASAVSWAKNLSASEKAAWQYYADQIAW